MQNIQYDEYPGTWSAEQNNDWTISIRFLGLDLKRFMEICWNIFEKKVSEKYQLVNAISCEQR